MTTRPQTPTQNEVNAVAHFVEAVRELRASPFFIEEYQNLKLSRRQGEPPANARGSFPDPNVVNAVLVPFRRLWQENEPCYYRKVANILKKHAQDEAEFIDSFVFSDNTSSIGAWLVGMGCRLTPSQVIKLWLNTKYMHTGRSATKGDYTREDLEQFQREVGSDALEFYFLQSVSEVAISFFNLQKLFCNNFLSECVERGIAPSFDFAMTSSVVEPNIHRHTPGFTPEENTPERRLWRLRRRRRYRAMAQLLEGVVQHRRESRERMVQALRIWKHAPEPEEFTFAELAQEVTKSADFDQFIANAKLRLEQVPDQTSFNAHDLVFGCAVMDDMEFAWKHRKHRTGGLGMGIDGVFYHFGECMAVLRDQYQELRTALLREPFE